MKQLEFLDHAIIPWLGKTAKFVGIYLVDKLQEMHIDLTKEQWIVLKVLHEEDGKVQNDLAIITDRSKTSLTRLIQTMEKKDLICRKPSSVDKRANHVFLTAKGKEIFKQSLPVIKQVLAELQSGITPEEFKTTLHVLSKIRTNIDNNSQTLS